MITITEISNDHDELQQQKRFNSNSKYFILERNICGKLKLKT